ncbi:MAG: hypothetical protein ISS80_04255 [Candidatus Cloacimonetes bacterium]|nr:hypothetical protein [Candidatus Cloacimonadota bacterium]MBL7149266.1 hypothetical protein [Candidatus Cloacimonadota bacterium]
MEKRYDLRLDIPARAMINGNIIEAVHRDTLFDKVKRQKLGEMQLNLNQADLDSYHLLDQSYVASLLYCLLVVPKELMNLSKNDELFQTLDNMVPALPSFFTLRETPPEFTCAPSYWLIRLLRNSISHVLYEIDSENNWIFWTERSPLWKASIEREHLMEFLSTVGRKLSNRALSIKNEQLRS